MSDLVKLIFIGSEPELTIDTARGFVLVKRGGTCDVPEKDAECLVARGDFQLAEEEKP